MSNLTIIRPVLATVQYPGIYTGFGQSGLAVSGDPTSWTPGRTYQPGQLVRSTRQSSYGSAGSGVRFEQAPRNRAAILNNPDPSLRYELTYNFSGRAGAYDGLNNIYVCVRTANNINPDAEHLKRNDPNEPSYFGRAQPGDENYIEPYWAFVSKVFQHSFTDETPTDSNGLKNSLVLDMICTDAIDTVALIGITGSTVQLRYTPNSSSSEVAYDSGVIPLSTNPVNADWASLITGDNDYSVDHVFRGLPKRAYPVVVNPSSSRSNTGRGQLRIIIRNPNGFARLGQVVLGNEQVIGMADAETLNIKGRDFSQIDFNPYGNVTRTVRNLATEQSVRALIRASDIRGLVGTYKDFRGARPAVFTTTLDSSSGPAIYGYIADYSFELEGDARDYAYTTIQVQELT